MEAARERGPVWAVREGPSRQLAPPAQFLEGKRICSLLADMALCRATADPEVATTVGTASGRSEDLPGTVASWFQLLSHIIFTIPDWREVHGIGIKLVEAG